MRSEQIPKQLTSSGVHYHGTLLGIRIFNLRKNGIFKAQIQTHWKLTVEILIDQFSCTSCGKKRKKKTT